MRKRKTIDVWDVKLKTFEKLPNWYTYITEYSLECAQAFIKAEEYKFGKRKTLIVERRIKISNLDCYERCRAGLAEESKQ